VLNDIHLITTWMYVDMEIVSFSIYCRYQNAWLEWQCCNHNVTVPGVRIIKASHVLELCNSRHLYTFPGFFNICAVVMLSLGAPTITLHRNINYVIYKVRFYFILFTSPFYLVDRGGTVAEFTFTCLAIMRGHFLHKNILYSQPYHFSMSTF
jgi:hypothetical protein